MTAINTAVIFTGNRRSARYVANELALDTSYGNVLWDRTNNDGAPIGAAGAATTEWLDKGAARIVTIDGTWVTSTGTPLTLKFFGTNDINGVVIVPLAYIPASATGSTPAYPQQVPAAKSDWGNAATDYVGFVVLADGWRYVKVQAEAAAQAGTFTAGATAWA